MRTFHLPGRSPVYARDGMVATSHPLASLAAVEMLRKRVVMPSTPPSPPPPCSAVVEQPMTGIGGDCFAIVAKPGATKPIAPQCVRAVRRQAATAEWYAARRASSSSTGPEPARRHRARCRRRLGATSLADHGTESRSSEVLAPAIAHAEGGFVIAPRVSCGLGRRPSRSSKGNEFGRPSSTCLPGWARAASRRDRHALPRRRARRLKPDRRARAATASTRARSPSRHRGVSSRQARRPAHARGLRRADARSVRRSRSRCDYNGVQLCTSCRRTTTASSRSSCSRCWTKLGKSVRDGPTSAGALPRAERGGPPRLRGARCEFVADPDMAKVPGRAHAGRRHHRRRSSSRIDRTRRKPDLGPVPRPAGSDTVYASPSSTRRRHGRVLHQLAVRGRSARVIATARRPASCSTTAATGFVLDPNAPQLHRAAQAADAHARARHGDEGRQAAHLAFGVMGAAFQPIGHTSTS
jgi:hypothetical protein